MADTTRWCMFWWSLVCMLMLGSGCTSIRLLDHNPRDEYPTTRLLSLKKLNFEIRDQQVKLYLFDGTLTNGIDTFSAVAVTVGAEETQWTDATDGKRYRVATSRVHQIERGRSSEGEGLAYGFVLAFPIGAAGAGYAMMEHDASVFQGLAVGVLVGAATMVSSVIFGGVKETTERYVVNVE